jgi:hypothetical protein
MRRVVSARADGKVSSISYGSIDLDPTLLTIWICVRTDDEKRRFSEDDALIASLRAELVLADYPAEGARCAFIGFESQETVDRESRGDWWGHFR